MSDPLVGATVTRVRAMTDEELSREGWHTRVGQTPVAIEFDDGTVLYPSKDPEGNGPGAMFGFADDDLIAISAPDQ